MNNIFIWMTDTIKCFSTLKLQKCTVLTYPINHFNQLTLMSWFTTGVNASHSFSRSPAPLKHHNKIPPLEKMLMKSNIILDIFAVEFYNLKICIIHVLINVLYSYGRRKYYCYHQNTK